MVQPNIMVLNMKKSYRKDLQVFLYYFIVKWTVQSDAVSC